MNARLAGTILLGWAAFLGARAAAKQLPGSPPWLPQAGLKMLMLGFALAMMWISRRPWTEFGFRKAAEGSWRRAVWVGAALGALSSFLILVLGGKGLAPVLRGISVPALVLTVWIWSSVAEEVFTRGWLQSSLVSYRWITSGIFFGSIHLSLLWSGVDSVTGPAIVVSTTMLGLWCGWLRERYGSLGPPLWAHMAFNAGGLVGGLLYAVLHIVRFGKPPAAG